MTTIKDTGDTAKSWEGREREIRDKFSIFWQRESQHTEQTYLTADTIGIFLDFIRTLLKEQREGMAEKLEGAKLLEVAFSTQRLREKEYYNKGINRALDLLKELNN